MQEAWGEVNPRPGAPFAYLRLRASRSAAPNAPCGASLLRPVDLGRSGGLAAGARDGVLFNRCSGLPESSASFLRMDRPIRLRLTSTSTIRTFTTSPAF